MNIWYLCGMEQRDGNESVEQFKFNFSMEEIAIALSGGGYRAAMFHLGTLSYLRHVILPNGKALLDIVNTISTISGGTITGLWYMMNYCKSNDMDKSFRDLFYILRDTDLPKSVLNVFLAKDNHNTSLIKETIKFYDQVFFHDQTFGLLMEKAEHGHIHHFSANGTDFSNGLAFRFQASRAIVNAEPQYKYGFIGNHNHNIPRNVAKKIKLSEILAVSSCFPGGFEPVVFPNDFYFYKCKECEKFCKGCKSFDLMDGGIVDNQGIEPVLLANKQMSYDDLEAQGKSDYPCHDLIIVSDVASPILSEMNVIDFAFPLKNMSLNKIEYILWGSLLMSIVLCVLTLVIHLNFISGIFFALSMLCGWFCGLLRNVLNRMIGILSMLPVDFDYSLIKDLPVGKVCMLLKNRVSSLLALAQSVFMKSIRQMRYKALYENATWKNRLLSNNVNELSSKGSWRWKKDYPDILKPSQAIVNNSDVASSMGTTLWFTDDDREKEIPEALFVCGQYTICMNLLEYIEKLKKNMTNTTDTHKLLLGCEQQLKSDWEQFLSNPKCLLKLVTA